MVPAVVQVVVDPSVPPTRADFNLLRAIPGLRARVLAAIVVPFLIYTGFMVLIGRMDVYLIWLFIPTVIAGTLVGHFLDKAHERVRSKPIAVASEISAAKEEPQARGIRASGQSLRRVFSRKSA